MTMIDLEPASRRLAGLLAGIDDEMLGRPTPCPDYTLGDLLDHVGGLAVAFTVAARKETGDGVAQGASGDASRLGDGWRDRIAADLGDLAAAWRDPAAWSGMTRAGGVDLPGDVAGLVALDELVVHGWDVAVASGQPFEVEPAQLEAVHGFVAQFAAAASDQEDESGGLFGPAVDVADGAPLLDRVIGLTGRDPGWSAP